MANTIDSYILDFANHQLSFTIDDVVDFCNEKQQVNKPYIVNRLSALVKQSIIARLGHGVYAKNDKAVFLPKLSDETLSLAAELRKSYPFVKFSIYEGACISPMLHHIAPNEITYIDVQKDAAEFVFDFLKGRDLAVYLSPDEDVMYRYVNLENPAVIVKPLISEAPLAKVDDFFVPTLEKLLVDIYRDADFDYLQGGEYYNIAENAVNLFILNKTKLYRYAQRRGVKQELEKIFDRL